MASVAAISSLSGFAIDALRWTMSSSWTCRRSSRRWAAMPSARLPSRAAPRAPGRGQRHQGVADGRDLSTLTPSLSAAIGLVRFVSPIRLAGERAASRFDGRNRREFRRQRVRRVRRNVERRERHALDANVRLAVGSVDQAGRADDGSWMLGQRRERLTRGEAAAMISSTIRTRAPGAIVTRGAT